MQYNKTVYPSLSAFGRQRTNRLSAKWQEEAVRFAEKGKCAFLPDEIYYDNSATTRTREEAAKRVYEMLTSCYGNPSSLHRKGFEAQQQLELARGQVAASLGCQSSEIYFTSGGT